MISWVHTVNDGKTLVYYAFTYPFTYTELQAMLSGLKQRFTPENPSLYYHCETLVNSLDGHRLDLVTVTSHLGKQTEREDDLPGLFPDLNSERSFRFVGKKVVFVSARVHPGETPSSFVFNGFLNFIVSNDQRAVKLRDVFVFKMIPMLNPDGVVRGHYRTDQRGVNLNRVYVDPSLKLHPTIYAARKIILYYHLGSPPISESDDLDGNLSSITGDTESSDISSSVPKVRPPDLDEDTCHSFGDVTGGNNDNSNIRATAPQSYMELDEPSASGWDISSNFSVESGMQTSFNQTLDVHDDCSNISCVSEAETGVTSMFGSLAKVSDFSTLTSQSSNKLASSGFLSHCKLDPLTEMNEMGSQEFKKSLFNISQTIKCNKCEQKIDELGESTAKCRCDRTLPSFCGNLPNKLHIEDTMGAKKLDSMIHDYHGQKLSLSPPFDKSPLNRDLKLHSRSVLNPSYSALSAIGSSAPREVSNKRLLDSLSTSGKEPPLASSSESEAESCKPGKELDIGEGILRREKQSSHSTEFTVPPPLISNTAIPSDAEITSGLHLYVDLHGHASKRGNSKNLCLIFAFCLLMNFYILNAIFTFIFQVSSYMGIGMRMLG